MIKIALYSIIISIYPKIFSFDIDKGYSCITSSLGTNARIDIGKKDYFYILITTKYSYSLYRYQITNTDADDRNISISINSDF